MTEAKTYKYSKDYQRKLARRLKGRQFLRMEAPPPSAAVACWSESTSQSTPPSSDTPAEDSSQTATQASAGRAEGEPAHQASADRAEGESSDQASADRTAADQSSANRAEGESADQVSDSQRSGKSILLKPRGPAQGFFNRDKLEQFSFFAK